MGIFVVWLPAMFSAEKFTEGYPDKDAWKALLRGCPRWMRRAHNAIFYYCIASFALFFLTSVGGPAGPGETGVVRGFSGHWLFFYFPACAVLYLTMQLQNGDPLRRCGNGHVVEPADPFCPKCGLNVGSALDQPGQ